MGKDTRYALEKLNLALTELVFLPGRVCERLAYAKRHFSAVTAADLPDKLQADFQRIENNLRALEDTPNDETGKDTAIAIQTLACNLEGYEHDRESGALE